MEDKVIWFAAPKNRIQTTHVFTNDEQVFLKREIPKSSSLKYHGEVWYPINFQWVSVIETRNNSIYQSA